MYAALIRLIVSEYIYACNLNIKQTQKERERERERLKKNVAGRFFERTKNVNQNFFCKWNF